MEELRKVLFGSKRYDFDYGVNGMTILSIQNYNSGEEVKLDLSVLFNYPEVVEEMINLAKEGGEE